MSEDPLVKRKVSNESCAEACALTWILMVLLFNKNLLSDFENNTFCFYSFVWTWNVDCWCRIDKNNCFCHNVDVGSVLRHDKRAFFPTGQMVSAACRWSVWFFFHVLFLSWLVTNCCSAWKNTCSPRLLHDGKVVTKQLVDDSIVQVEIETKHFSFGRARNGGHQLHIFQSVPWRNTTCDKVFTFIHHLSATFSTYKDLCYIQCSVSCFLKLLCRFECFCSVCLAYVCAKHFSSAERNRKRKLTVDEVSNLLVGYVSCAAIEDNLSAVGRRLRRHDNRDVTHCRMT